MTKYFIFILTFVLLILCGCTTITPYFSSFQDAKIPPGQMEVTPNYCAVGTYDPEIGIESHHIGIQIGGGPSKKAPFLGFSSLWDFYFLPSDPDTNRLGFFSRMEIKLCPIRDILTLSTGSGIHLRTHHWDFLDLRCFWQYELISMYLTIPLHKKFDISLAPKYILMLSNQPDENKYIAININVGINQKFDRTIIVFRPEMGYLHNLDGDNHHVAVGIAASFYTKGGGRRKK